MLEYDFMVNAFMASGIVAVLAGIVCYFLVMRGQTFAGHALAHVGFSALVERAFPFFGYAGLFQIAAIALYCFFGRRGELCSPEGEGRHC